MVVGRGSRAIWMRSSVGSQSRMNVGMGLPPRRRSEASSRRLRRRSSNILRALPEMMGMPSPPRVDGLEEVLGLLLLGVPVLPGHHAHVDDDLERARVGAEQRI